MEGIGNREQIQATFMATLAKQGDIPESRKAMITSLFDRAMQAEGAQSKSSSGREEISIDNVAAHFMDTVAGINREYKAGNIEVEKHSREVQTLLESYKGIFTNAGDDVDKLKALKTTFYQYLGKIKEERNQLAEEQKKMEAEKTRPRSETATLAEDLAEIARDMKLSFRMDLNRKKIENLDAHEAEIKELAKEVDDKITLLESNKAKRTEATLTKAKASEPKLTWEPAEIKNPQVAKELATIEPFVKGKLEILLEKREEHKAQLARYEQLLNKFIALEENVTQKAIEADLSEFMKLHRELDKMG